MGDLMKDDHKTKKQLIHELTELRSQNAALKESESAEKYRSLVENIRDVIYELDSQGVVLYISPVIRDMLGYDSAEIVGKNFIELAHKDDLSGLAEWFSELRKGVESPSEYRIIKKSGELRWARTKTRPIMEDGQFKGARGILIDITDQRRVEEALRESEKKYRWMVHNMADVITVIDMNLRFTYVSPAIMRLRGYTAEEATAQTFEQVMTPESLQIIAKVFEEEMKLEASGTADPGRSRILELEQYKKDGSIVWIENDLSFVRDEAQKPVGIISLSRDITDRKRAEEELLSKAKSLEELNTALNVLIDHYKNDQREFEERIMSNIRVSIIPYIEKIKRTRLDIDQSALIEIIERNFRDISSPFLKSISSEYFRFTTKEIEIVSLIKDGKTTKEIAQILYIGKRTVDSYRDNIRGKLRLANKKVNLKTYLLSISNT